MFLKNSLANWPNLYWFIAGDSQTGINKRSLYEHNGVAVCSQKRAMFIATMVLATLFVISLIIAYAGPQNGNYI
jgi:hypothetical protein